MVLTSHPDTEVRDADMASKRDSRLGVEIASMDTKHDGKMEWAALLVLPSHRNFSPKRFFGLDGQAHAFSFVRRLRVIENGVVSQDLSFRKIRLNFLCQSV